MPTIEVSHSDLCNLIGTVIPVEEMKEKAILYAKGEIDEVNGDKLKIDIKDTNRPDLWSAEGIAREIKGRYASGGLPNYETGKSGIVVRVDRKLKGIRPLTVCAVVRGLDINEDVLSQMIQLQEKVSLTFGRKRKEVAIGAYDLHRIKPPIKFTTVKPEGIRFAPLEFSEKMTPKEILEKHPKGKEFCHLLAGCKEYPIFIDSAGNVLSMPPIINSDYTGKITENTRDLFIECSGFEFRFLLPALNVIVAALADRGGRVETVKVAYPDRTMETPDLKPKKALRVDVNFVNKLSGLNLTVKEVCKLLGQARYGVRQNKNRIEVLYPAYRQDIMHQRDITEDIMISYGYSNIRPEPLKLATTGRQDCMEVFSEKVASVIVGLGFQEIVSYTLTNKRDLFEKMCLKESPAVEIENAVSSNWSVFRGWLLPSLLEFLSSNKHVEYPQCVFEIGDCVIPDNTQPTKARDVRKLAAARTNSTVNYEEIASCIDALMKNVGVDYKLKAMDHPSFIKGRCAEIYIGKKQAGFAGEINPQVLNNWNIEKPVVVFEVDVELLNNNTQRGTLTSA